MTVNKSVKKRWYIPLVLLGLIFQAQTALGQSNLKEGNNQFALYSKSGDMKQLEAARKFADEAYKTRRDTIGFRNNLLRALVYSTLSVADSNRVGKYTEDPIEIAQNALNKLKDRQLIYENEPEINHAKRNLANGHLILANKALKSSNLDEAYQRFRKVDSIDSRTYPVKYNLAVIAGRLEKYDDAIAYYSGLIKEPRTAKSDYIQALADIYEIQGKQTELMNILITGREMYPNDKDVLFRLINAYKTRQSYENIIPLIDQAVKFEPDNIELLYIAAYAYDMTNQYEKAKNYYENVINLDRNHYSGNFGIGLIYLKEYLDNPKSRSLQTKAQDYLLKANQISPSALNTLKSLAVLYETKGDIIQLERVNNILDQLTLH